MIVSRRKRADQIGRVVLVCLVAGLAGAAWLALRPPAPVEPSRPPAASQSPVQATAPVAPAADERGILWPGASAASPRQPSLPAGFPASGSETVPFTIQGVIASLSGPSSVVFVQSPSSGDLMIRLGEVAEGWKLIRVKGSTATFAKQGREVTLSLAEREYGAGGDAAPPSAPSGPSHLPRQVVRQVPIPFPSPGLQPPAGNSVAAASASAGPTTANGDDSKAGVPRSVWDTVRTNPFAAMQGVQIEPLMSNGQMQGFTIANVAAGALAAPYVAPGDQILAVNGIPINSAASAWNIYEQLRNNGSTSVTVTLARGGQRQNVVYSIQ